VPVTATNFAISLKKSFAAAGVRKCCLSSTLSKSEQGSPILEGLVYGVITLMYLLLAIHHGTGWPY
jgi:hypothetical protein